MDTAAAGGAALNPTVVTEDNVGTPPEELSPEELEILRLKELNAQIAEADDLIARLDRKVKLEKETVAGLEDALKDAKQARKELK